MSNQYVLACIYSSGPHKGLPQYFKEWTAIGPCSTPDIKEAERFATRQDATLSPAYSHWSSMYEIKEVGDSDGEGIEK